MNWYCSQEKRDSQMNHRTIFYCLLTVVRTFGGSPSVALADNDDKAAEYIIILYDGSQSMGMLPEPDTAQAFITELIHVASISRRPVKIAVILFNGNGVKVLGDDKNMPTAALASLHKKVLQEWQEPFGPTPQDGALQECVRMVQAVPSEANVTVINFGDGHPESGRLRPDDFEEVREMIDRRIESIRKLAYPPRTTQQLIDRFLAAVKTPGTEEWKEVYEKVQRKAEFELCKRHAAVLKGAKVRFISVDFAGGIEPLREIHQSAGGLDADYLIVQPANTVIKRLHDLRVTQLDGIVVPRPVHLPADQSTFQKAYEHLLDKVGEAALVTVVFHRSIEDFADHCELSIDAGGATYTFDTQNSDPNAILSFDSAGKVATATLVLPSMPTDGRVTIRFRSPGSSMHPPEMTIYTHLRLSSDLEPVFRPEHVPPDQRPPFTLDPNRAVKWLAWIGVKDDPKPIPLGGIEPVWKNRSDGRTIRIELEEDQQTPGIFRSANKSRIPAGQFDLDVTYILDSGAQFRLKIPMHLQSQRSDEYIAIEIDQSSRSSDHFAFGEVGGTVRECEVKALIRSMNLDYPVAFEFVVVGLADANGKPPQNQWVYLTRKQMTLQPGRAYPLTLKLRLPDLIEDALEDGQYTARLQCRRVDLDAVMDLRPLRDLTSTGARTVDEITLSLHRPTFSLRVPRGPKDQLEQRQDRLRLPLRVDFGPFCRSVVICVGHDSNEPRDVELTVAGTFQDANGRDVPSDKVSLVLTEGSEATQEVEPGDEATFRLLLDVREPLNCQTVLRFSGAGLRTLEFPVVVEPRRKLLGATVRKASYGIGLMILPLAVLALVRRMRAAPYGAGNQCTLTPTRPFQDITVEAGRRNRARLFFKRLWNMRRERERREKPVRSPLPVSDSEIQPGNAMILTEQEADGMQIALRDYYVTDDATPEIHLDIIEAERFDREIARHGKSFRRRLLVAMTCGFLGYFFFTAPVIRAAQYIFDIVRL